MSRDDRDDRNERKHDDKTTDAASADTGREPSAAGEAEHGRGESEPRVTPAAGVVVPLARRRVPAAPPQKGPTDDDPGPSAA